MRSREVVFDIEVKICTRPDQPKNSPGWPHASQTRANEGGLVDSSERLPSKGSRRRLEASVKLGQRRGPMPRYSKRFLHCYPAASKSIEKPRHWRGL